MKYITYGILTLIGAVILTVSILVYRTVHNRKDTEEIEVFFKFAQKQLPNISAEIEKLKKEQPLNQEKLNETLAQQHTYKMASVIAKRDSDTISKMTLEELQGGQIEVDANHFKNTMQGRLNSRMIGGENAINFALFYSVNDRTATDKKKTLEIIKILLDKKLNPNAMSTTVYFVKDKPSDSHALDYVGHFSATALAILYGYPELLELLLQNGGIVKQAAIDDFLNNHDPKENIPNAAEFKKVIERYKSQIR
jgi:hypothetical protein